MATLVLLASLLAVVHGSVFHDLQGLKPRRSCEISELSHGCHGLNKVKHRFHHTDHEGRFTGLHFDLEHHPNLKLLDGHDKVDFVECFDDHLLIKRRAGAEHLFPAHVDYAAEDHFVSGSLIHNCPDNMPVRRRIKAVTVVDDTTARVETTPAELVHIVKDSTMRFYTNRLAQGKDDPTPQIDEIKAGRTPHEYGEYTYAPDGSWGVVRESSDTDRKLNGFLHHAFHHIGHAFHHVVHHVGHSVGHFFHKVGHAVGTVVHKVVNTVKTVVASVKNLAEFAWDQLTGKAYKKSFSEHKTFGWNYNTQTHSAKAPIVLNAKGHLPVRCDDCYAEMDFGLDAEFEIKSFKVDSAAMTIEGHEHVHVNANSKIGMTVTKAFGPDIISKMKLVHIHFFIGPVPVFIDFDLQIETGGHLSFSAGASLDSTIDDERILKLGWAYKKTPSSWPASAIEHGDHSMSRLVYYNVQSNMGQLNGHAELDVAVGLYVQPTLSVSVDKIIHGHVSIKPEMTSELTISEDFHAESHHLLSAPESDTAISAVDRELAGVQWSNVVDFNFNIYFRLSVGAYCKVAAFGKTFLDKNWPIYDSGLKTIYHKHWTKNTGSHASSDRRLLMNDVNPTGPHFKFGGIEALNAEHKRAWAAHYKLQKDMFPVHTMNVASGHKEPELTFLHDSIENTRSADVLQRSTYACPRNDTCTVATGLVHCPGLNGKRVCVRDQDELLEHDAMVGKFLEERKTYGDAAVRHLRAFQCEMLIPICDPVPYESTVTKLCHHQCVESYEVMGFKKSVAHARCRQKTSHYYSPVSEVTGAQGGTCKRLATAYDDVAREEHNSCEKASELTHCPHHNGKHLHFDKRQYRSLKELDAFVGALHKAHQDENEHSCPAMTKELLCAEYMPECVKTSDLDKFYEENNITDNMWDYEDDPNLPEGPFHIILPMCAATCEHHLSSCAATKDHVYGYCKDMSDPHVRARFAPPDQQACGHRLPQHVLMASSSSVEATVEEAAPKVSTVEVSPTNAWKTWQVLLCIFGTTVLTALVTLGASHQWMKKKRVQSQSEIGLAEYVNLSA